MYISDLHIHSSYSRATSRDTLPETLDLWARKKGIHIVGTGDFTHSAWRAQLEEKLEPDQDGFYVLKDEYRIRDASVGDHWKPRFVVTGEISSIYKKNDRVRKVHSLLILPGLEDAKKISRKLEDIGNIHSDGRPILGIDCKDLLEIMLELSPKGMYVPAHIWTPHFSLFGAFSGFDSVEECFEDLSPHIHAMETGLSSDPPMNWRISALDQYQLISNSDAHSPSKLGREANLMDIEFNYDGLYDAICEGRGLAGTIEFFPEEGKYHFDGHRKCHLCLSPSQADAYNGRCPVCGKKLTIGVSHRIEQLADRPQGYVRKNPLPFESLMPLTEVIAAATGHSSSSVKVLHQYEDMLHKLGNEFDILRHVDLEDIRHNFGELTAQGIDRLRRGLVKRIPGFDGEYGTIKLFTPDEISNPSGQLNLFDFFGMEGLKGEESWETQAVHPATDQRNVLNTNERTGLNVERLNDRQAEAVNAIDPTISVVAGPGTGKTKTLVAKIIHLIEIRKVKASHITAVTFTNKAAAEMKARLGAALGRKRTVANMQIGTFHSICLELLKKQGMEFTLADSVETLEIAGDIVKAHKLAVTAEQFLQKVSLLKTQIDFQEKLGLMEDMWQTAVTDYQDRLKAEHMLDFDDLLMETLRRYDPAWTTAFDFIFVDEFQDINPVQYALIQKWNSNGRELFVIGDPDQAIYGFRGADARCFDRLWTQYPNTHRITLENNYRSAPQIVNCAMSVISKNPGGERCLRSCVSDGPLVRMVTASSQMSEAIFVAREINRQVGGIDMLDAQEKLADTVHEKIRSFADIGILYRTHSQARLLEKALSQEGIPYVVSGRDDFLNEKAVRGTIAFFRSIQKPEDIPSRKACLKLLWSLNENELSNSVYENLYEKYAPLFAKGKPAKVMKMWIEDMNFSGNVSIARLEEMAVCYKTMPDFLNELLLGVESDLARCGGRHYTADAVRLMTLHGSKGLEFPVTIICGFCQGRIPYENDQHPSDLEEERRLFFVGMTRAKEELILTGFGEPSIFEADLACQYLNRETAVKLTEKKKDEQLSLFDFMG